MVLFVNFPVCVVYFVVGLTVHSANYVTIKNELSIPIDQLTLTDSRKRSTFYRAIKPGTYTRCIGLFGDTSVYYTVEVGSNKRHGTLTQYLASNVGQHFELAVPDSLQVAVREVARLGSMEAYLRYCIF